MAGGPEHVSQALVARLREGDVDGLEELYEPGAVFADYAGLAVGWAEIRRTHLAFLESGAQLELDEPLAVECGDLALVQWTWTVRHADGSELSGASAEVLRKQTDGSWRFVIDNSDGAALIGVL